MADNYSINAVFSLKDMFSGPLDKIKRNMHDTAQEPKKLTDSLAGIAKGAGVFTVVSKGLDAVKDSVGSAVSRFDTLNQYPKVMKQMGYSTDDTNQSINVLKRGIEGLPTALQDITKNAQSFAILTGSAKKGADTANALNDAFLAAGASAADASRGVQQYSQMLAAGKVDMQSWRTLTETMPYALNEVAKSFGFTGKSAQKDLYSALEQGKITTEQLNDKFMELDGGVNGFANTARTATGGINTSFENMKNAVVKGITDTLTTIDNGLKQAGIDRGVAGLLDKRTETIKSSFEKINRIISDVIPHIVTTLSSLFNLINNNKDWIVPLTVGLSSAVASYKAYIFFANIATVSTKIFANAFESVQIYSLYLKEFASSSNIASAAVSAFKETTGKSLIGPGMLALQAIIVALSLFFTKTETGRKAWEKLSESVSKATSKIVSVVTPAFSKIANFTTSTFSAIASFTKSSFESIKNSVDKTLSNAGTSMGTVMSSMRNSAKNGESSIANSFEQMKNNVGNAFASIRQSSSGIFEKIGESIGKVVIAVTPAIESLTNFLSTAQGFRSVASIFVGIATSLIGMAPMIKLWTKMFDII